MARGRPRKIDPEIALEKSMKLFWEKGYDGTSMNDIVEITGMAKPGIYATFGDKQQLYLKALDHYFNSGGAAVFNELAHSKKPAYDAILECLEAIAASVQLSESPQGCMIVNNLIECANKDQQLSGFGHTMNEMRHTAFTACLTQALQNNELAPTADIDALADFFSAQTLAIAVMGRSGSSKESIHSLISVAMSTLPLTNSTTEA